MAFPAEGGPREHLDDVLTKVRRLARSVKGSAQSMRAQSAAGNVSVMGVVLLMDDLQQADTEFTRLASTPGLADYAREAYADANFDIAAEFNAMVAQIRNTVSWISTNAPTDGRWLQASEIVSGRLVERMLTPAQTANLRPILDALIATIN